MGAFVVAGEAMRRVQRQMARDINHAQYDVAFVHACRFSLSVPIAEWLTVPCVFYAQETRRVGFEAQPPRPASQQRNREKLVRLVRRPYESLCRRRDRQAVAAVDRVLCNSRFSADMLTAAYGINPIVCYLGVDDKVFRPSDELPTGPTPLSRGLLRVLSIGALHPVKGHELALAATARAASITSARGELHIVYERERPGHASELDRLARSLGVGLHLHRGIPDEELVNLYRSAEVTVCAARLEPFGLTVLESTSCGTPVVAVAQGGYRETVIDGVNGYLAERDPTSVGDKIVRIVSGDLSSTPADLHDLVSRLWSWDQAAKRIADQLRLAVSRATSDTQPPTGTGTESTTMVQY
jgi:glycosyltransferase involved in cell wall biosynthesis